MDLPVMLPLIMIFMCCLCLSHAGIIGGGCRSTSSGKEDLELERQLKLLNKPAVKTIETDYGDIYDCVDFYKQPAFDHPLLRNHTFHPQMKPTSSLPEQSTTYRANSSNIIELKELNDDDGGCPLGTVPIRRITKEDLVRERLASRTMAQQADNGDGVYFALVRTRAGPRRFGGAGTEASVWHPNATGKQYSAARIKIFNGPDSIQAGWRVDQSLYKDTRTRFYVRLDTPRSHCFNTQCPGFVVVSRVFPIDAILEPISKPGGKIYYVKFYIKRDILNGNWWLHVGLDQIQIGFWPKNLFSGLKDLASGVEWGGSAYSPPGQALPSMGSGTYPKLDLRYDSYFAKIAVANETGQFVDADNTEELSTQNKFYQVADFGLSKQFGHLVLYGGPGGGRAA